MTPSTDSAPELQKKTWGSSRKGHSRASRSASSTLGWLCTTIEVWMSVAAWRWMASTTRGWQCPTLATAMPAARSRYRRPSASTTQLPWPRSATTSK